MYTWSLDALYENYGASFKKDLNYLEKQIPVMNEAAESLESKEDLEAWLKMEQNFYEKATRLRAFVFLNLAANSSDSESNAYEGFLSTLLSQTSRANALYHKFLVSKGDVFAQWIQESDLIREHQFVLQEIIDQGDYLLHEDVEAALSLMRINASNTWKKLQEHLSSTATVSFHGKTHTLSSIRNFAYSQDAAVRKEAYEAELKLYEQIDDSLAFSLNSIKGEVNLVSKLRGYDSPLEATLQASRLTQETLDALLQAMRNYLPVFRKYLKHKATLLGHESGLPWYDLFAPFEVTAPQTYSIDDSKKIIVESFADFSDDLADMAQRAYDEKWIDFLPREGKRGGAFCSNLSVIKQSRILTNYDESISDVVTLAHELGHAYHGMMIEDFSLLNTDYSMPVAETASTFCENIVLNAALKTATDDEKLVLIENSLQDVTQIIVDILSRYQFETEVFERRQHSFLFAKDLKDIMLQAQRDTYGDGLDPNVLHPYMWACKGHYYSASRSFYNFPYAFGGLFALGLYAKFQEDGAAFVPKYQNLLKATTTATCEDVAKMADIDTTDIAFWESSLEVISKRIDQFMTLTSPKS